LDGLTCLVTPDTLMRWYRRLVAQKYDGSRGRGPGRPRTSVDVARLVRAMASDNPGWGYTRSRGALFNVGHDVGRNTIRRMLLDAGLEPAPERSRRPTWKAFLKAHAGAIAAMDFFAVEVVTMAGLVRYLVLFTIDLASRRVQVAGITHDPWGAWMAQIARNLTDAAGRPLRNAHYLIHDRDPLFTAQFLGILKAAGVKSVKLPARSPNLNAFAERWVRSCREESLRRIIPLGEKHLRNVMAEFVEHYNLERNHQGRGNRLLVVPPTARSDGPIRRRERLGGVLNFYHREAA
jgi:transposase InsO family protein